MSVLRRSPRSPVARSALVLVTRAADRSMLWLGMAAALGLAGRRRARRAALRGVFGMGLAAGVANGPLKLAFRRPRPVTARIAAALPVFPKQSTPSFPSGHAAAGFAFAAGAAQELPVLAPPLLGLAALVGYARVHSGVHRREDALVGAAVGFGAGLLTRRLWPVAPNEPAQVRTALARADIEPSATGKGLVIVVNPSAGSSERAAEELRSELPDAEVVELAEGDDLPDALLAASARADVLGVVGGDGSVNTAAELAADKGQTLLVVPGGTLNHFAHALGLESIADAAAAVRDGRAAGVDRALIDGRTFVNTASIGSYVELVDAREKLQDTIGKWPAVVVALWGVLRRSEPVDLELDGDRRKVWMIFVGNCRYHPSGFAPSWRERLDDGELDIRIVDGSHPWSRLRLLLSVMTGRLARSRAYEQRYVRSMHVKSLQGPIRLARDGETFDGPVEFDICKAEEPILVYVPEAEA